jgi:glycosyltransferase involved in cell wall biosynthesis
MMNQLVSAIIPTYNRAALLARALESVIAQTYRPIEAVVVDDGSTDNTDEVIDRYRTKLEEAGISLVYYKQSNGKAPLARNNGIKLSKGPLIAFLDSDDLWKPGLVDALAGLLARYHTAALAFCGILVIDENDIVWKERSMRMDDLPPEGILEKPFHRLIKYMPLQTSGVMIRRSVIEELGDFNLDMPVVEDWDLWYRISKLHDFAYTQRGLACNRWHDDNLPKLDITALSSSLKMNLQHLPDIQDEQARCAMRARLRRQFTLLQEELLRAGKGRNGCSQLLSHEQAPRTARFMAGSIAAKSPAWVGRSYGRLVRAVGMLRRGD